MKRSLIIKIGTLAVILGIAACMFVIGRGHTVYFDNKELVYEGQTVEAPYRIAVFVNGERVARLSPKDRGMATWIGQNFKMTVEVTQEKGAEAKSYDYSLKLPHGWDGIVYNLPALIAGLPEEAYRSEFVSLATEYVPGDDEEIVTDEFALGDI